MTKRLLSALLASIVVAACASDPMPDDETSVATNEVRTGCGGAGQACCETGPRCDGELE